VTTPNAGDVSITESETTETPPSSYTFVDQQVEITAPDATAGDPLVIEFFLDGSLLTLAGLDYTTVQILRNGVPVPPCTGADATPDPCVAERAALPPPDGSGARIVVRTSQASIWNFGKRAPFDVESSLAPLNTANAGRTVPIRFDLGGDLGFNVFAYAYPRSVQIADCTSTDPAAASEPTTSPGASSITYSPGTGEYKYLWKTDKRWRGQCRQLVLRFIDGSYLRANFDFR
jgi:hypothetical protein